MCGFWELVLHLVVEFLFSQPSRKRVIANNLNIRTPFGVPFDYLAKQVVLEAPLRSNPVVPEEYTFGDQVLRERVAFPNELVHFNQASVVRHAGEQWPKEACISWTEKAIEG